MASKTMGIASIGSVGTYFVITSFGISSAIFIKYLYNLTLQTLRDTISSNQILSDRVAVLKEDAEKLLIVIELLEAKVNTLECSLVDKCRESSELQHCNSELNNKLDEFVTRTYDII